MTDIEKIGVQQECKQRLARPLRRLGLLIGADLTVFANATPSARPGLKAIAVSNGRTARFSHRCFGALFRKWTLHFNHGATVAKSSLGGFIAPLFDSGKRYCFAGIDTEIRSSSRDFA